MDYRVVIPTESYHVIEFVQEGEIGVAEVNVSLIAFEPKIVFPWHCSLMIVLEDRLENGLPTDAELSVFNEFDAKLDYTIKQDTVKPNALRLASIQWNGTIELIWRVYDPEVTNQYLVDMLESKSYTRPFDYKISNDSDWSLCDWHFRHLKM